MRKLEIASFLRGGNVGVDDEGVMLGEHIKLENNLPDNWRSP